MLRKNAFLFGILLLTLTVYSQDSNYWLQSYGPGSFLTPGSAISKNGDSGVLFYNPALLAYNTKNAASISGNLYNYQTTTIKNGVGTGLDLKSTGVNVIPLLISNTIFLNLKGKPISIAYGLLHAPVIGFDATQRRDTKMNVLNESYSPGDEFYVGQFSVNNSVNETNGILSIGKTVTSKLAAGITFNVNVRKQSLLVDYKSRALINVFNNLGFQPLVNVSNTYQASNTNIGLGVKFGLAYDVAPKHHIGLLITTPLIHLSGSSTLVSDEVVNNLVTGSDTFYLLANGRQTKLKSKWKTPLSAALGYTYEYEGGQLFFSVEYFAKVKEYNVITPRNDYFLRPDTANNAGTSLLLKMKDAKRTLFNFALGASFAIKQSITGFASFRTDFSYMDEKLFKDFYGVQTSLTNLDIYHLQLGANFKKRKFNLRSGIVLSHGSTNQFQQSVNFDHPSEENFLLGEALKTKAARFSAGVIFSYIHNL